MYLTYKVITVVTFALCHLILSVLGATDSFFLCVNKMVCITRQNLEQVVVCHTMRSVEHRHKPAKTSTTFPEFLTIGGGNQRLDCDDEKAGRFMEAESRASGTREGAR